MKLSRIQIIFLSITLVTVIAFSAAGATGFRLVSVFSKKTWRHTSRPGIYPAPIIFYHK